VEDFDAVAPALSAHYDTIAFERTGHGHTADTDSPFGYQSMAAQVAGFMRAIGWESARVLGWSDGAIVALTMGIAYPGKVKSLVSVGGSFDAKAQDKGTIEWIKKSTPESFRKDQRALTDRFDRISPDGSEHFPVVFSKTMKLWLTEPDIKKEQLAQISVPTLIMVGDRDAVPLEHTVELHRAIKGSQLCVVPGTSHFLLSEKPDLAASIVLGFLLGHE